MTPAATKKRNRRTTVRLPLFDRFKLILIQTSDVEKTAKRLKNDMSNARAGYCDQKDQPGVGWLIFSFDDIDAGLIAHEVTHAVRAALKYHGVGRGEETVAYSQEYLVNRVHKFLKRKNGNKKG